MIQLTVNSNAPPINAEIKKITGIGLSWNRLSATVMNKPPKP